MIAASIARLRLLWRDYWGRRERGRTRQALVFDTISDGVIVMDVEGRVTDWNPAAERIFGYTKEEMLGHDVERIHDPRLHGAREREIRQSLARDGRWSGELSFRRKDGVEGVVDVVVVVQRDGTGKPTAWIGVNRDVTERKRAEEALRKSEEQLRQSQRLEAVGLLAGGVAHDFNNMLTAIRGYSDLLLEELEAADPKREEVQEIRKAADRATALTRQLLAFSRRQLLRPRVLDLNHSVAEMENMLRRLVVDDIKVVTALDSKLGCVKADPGQIEQVLMNLVVNARDAMPDGGTVTIETANVEVTGENVGQYGPIPIPSGAYVRLSVSDSGCGMDAATQTRIFEPFFTTKEPGKGTGLGLSTVYGIVKQSGGYVWCDSEQGRGTTFKIYLPLVDEAPELAAAAPRATTQRGSETVLLVEDDEAVRSVTRRILDKEGYTVLEATNGTEALRLCEEGAWPVDLVVSDLVMPQMSGAELARRLRAGHPEIRLLFMSGYTAEAALKQSFLEPGTAFIEKPFAPEAFASKVREALDRPPAARAPAGAYRAPKVKRSSSPPAKG